MRVLVNEPLIANRTNWGRRIMSVGFAFMLLAIVLSFDRLNVLRAYAAMVVGLILINAGVFVGGKWLRSPRPDQILDKALKGVDHGCRLYNYLLPADHVLLTPPGLFVLTLRFQDGQISGRGDKWRRRLNVWGSIRALFEPWLGNPSREARKEAAKVQSWLQKHLAEAQVPVHPLIVFVNPKAQLQIEEPSVPAVALADLKSYLRTALKDKALPRETLQAIADLCDEQGA